MLKDERQVIFDAFAPGTRFNKRVQEILAARGDTDAAAQCSSPEEAAAHGFALWCAKRFKVEEAPRVDTLFGRIRSAFDGFTNWITDIKSELSLRQTWGDAPEEQKVMMLFESLSSGMMAERARAAAEDTRMFTERAA